MDLVRQDFDVVTGETIITPLTAKEIEQLQKDAKDFADEVAKKNAAIAQREAAEAKLAALGLTADDLKALGLG